MVREGLVALALALAVPGCTHPVVPEAPAEPPAAPRQFRGAWVATVANIDWPSKKGLTSAEQRAEILRIVDRAEALHLNALVLQVRPSADAIYPSELEPWTEYVSGAGAANPDYDPLAMWVAEAHRRGIELHAWFNPYRARHKDATGPIAENHVSKVHPEIVKSYGGYLWLDPGEAESAALTLNVILDVVRRYDVDGVHIDDYFYPYPEGGVDFPDEPSWSRYTNSGGTLSKADWRRKNVSDLIERIYSGVHGVKSWVKFGISPFGLGRPDRRPPGVTGFSQYDQLYADVETWLEKGWLDYLAPQLYWPRTHKVRPFALLLDGWMKGDTSGRHVWPGLNTSAFSRDEIAYETELAPRGHIHFSMKALLDERSLYETPALVPATSWLSAPPTEAPVMDVRAGHVGLFAKNAVEYAVWSRRGPRWELAIVPAERAELSLDRSVDAIVASAVDRVGNESPRVRWSRP